MDINDATPLGDVRDAFLKNGGHVLIVDPHEYGLIVSGLRTMRRKLRSERKRDLLSGWVPEPGKANLTELRSRALAALMERLGINERGDRR